MNTTSKPEQDSRIGTACAVFSASFGVLYGLTDVYRWPLLSYYPATGRIEWGWTPETPDDGPAMYWYGWLLSSMLGALLLAGLSRLAPAALRRLIPMHICWWVPLLMVSVMAYTLRVYWR
jgi:hypothetical protein